MKEERVQFRKYGWKLKILKQLKGRQLKGSGDGFKGHGEEPGKQTNGKELKVFLGMVLPGGCYMEVGQTRRVSRHKSVRRRKIH